MKTHLSRAFLALFAVAALIGLGCASAGGDAPERPDYTNEIGENGLLTPRALVARYIEAIGGEEAIRSGDSVTMKGTMTMPAMGVEGDLVLYSKAPNKMVMDVELGGMGSMSTGFNGVHGWSVNPMTGPQLLEGQMLKEMKRQADFYAELSYADTYPTQETLEEVEFAGHPAYKVRLVDEDGKESFQYFDRETSYLIGMEGKQASEMGEMDVTTEMTGYQEFGGLLLPTSTTLKMMGMEIQQSVDEVSFEPIDSSAFEPPEAIQKLIEAQEAKEEEESS